VHDAVDDVFVVGKEHNRGKNDSAKTEDAKARAVLQKSLDVV